ncbi:hypothetical protein, partial [Qingrenia yutianensis]
RMLAGMETGLAEDDLTEDGVIDDKILCLIINAKFIEKYGLRMLNEFRASSVLITACSVFLNIAVMLRCPV